MAMLLVWRCMSHVTPDCLTRRYMGGDQWGASLVRGQRCSAAALQGALSRASLPVETSSSTHESSHLITCTICTCAHINVIGFLLCFSPLGPRSGQDHFPRSQKVRWMVISLANLRCQWREILKSQGMSHRNHDGCHLYVWRCWDYHSIDWWKVMNGCCVRHSSHYSTLKGSEAAAVPLSLMSRAEAPEFPQGFPYDLPKCFSLEVSLINSVSLKAYNLSS